MYHFRIAFLSSLVEEVISALDAIVRTADIGLTLFHLFLFLAAIAIEQSPSSTARGYK
jgi:hypothetical protein